MPSEIINLALSNATVPWTRQLLYHWCRPHQSFRTKGSTSQISYTDRR